LSEPGASPASAVAAAQSLEERALGLARAHRALQRAGAHSVPLVDLAGLSRSVDAAVAKFGTPKLDDPVYQKAAEWLLDNHYLIARTIRQVKSELPAPFRRRLSQVGSDELPRTLRVARAVIESTNLDFDEATLLKFIAAYQTESPLAIAELWALPTMLRISVLEALVAILATFFPSPRDEQPASVLSVAPDIGVGRAVSALRQLAEIDWRVFFQQTSAVETALRSDPSGIYARMDFATRDTYRKVVEELAWGANLPEPEVAALVVSRAVEHASDPRRGHVGYYLVDRGRRALERELSYRARGNERWRRAVLAHPTWFYLGTVLGWTLLLLACLVDWGSRRFGAGGTLALCVLAAVPLSSIVVAFTNWIITSLLPPRTLPKLDFSEGIPENCKSAIVIPALIATSADVDELLVQLELHYLSNPDPALSFVLLSDHVDTADKPNDRALLAHAARALDALNQKHGVGERKPFHVLHRNASWNEAEGHFMGWERKRGKLEELNRLLRGDATTSFRHHLGDAEGLLGIRFVITLDSDTRLPLGAAHELVGLLAHPLNHAEFDPDTGRVTSGYTVVQPRVEPSPIAQTTSWFSRVFMGDTAVDIYTRAVSDVYQDLFGAGVYVGKGIYEVDTFARSLEGRVPENALASHDLFEGIHGRAALATDIILFEEYPHHYLAFARRLHRWIRGDWQLLPWVLPHLHVPAGQLLKLRPIDHWKIADNLRRSLLAPSLLCLLLLGWLISPEHALAWSLTVLAAPLLMSLPCLIGDRPSEAVGRWAFGVAMLPYEAGLAADAIVRVLVRLLITRKHLLQWVTAANTARRLGKPNARSPFFSEMRWSALFTLVLMGAVAGLRPWLLLPLGPLFAVWLLAPEIARWASTPCVVHHTFTRADRGKLRLLARRTWLFFETFVGPADQWLPPDNFQQEPGGKIAHRTSPTNIGLLLTAQLCARDLGYIGPAELSAMLHHSLDSLARLERYRGHWLNWYDTKNGEPLLPRYVSTVDSGNLAAAFITLAKGCRDQADTVVLAAARWEGLSDTLTLLEDALDALLSAHPELRREIVETRGAIGRGSEPHSDRRGALLELSASRLPELERALLEALERSTDHHDVALFREARTWLERLHHQLRGLLGDIESLLPWLALANRAKDFGLELGVDPESASTLSLSEVRQTCAELQATLRAQHRDGASNEYLAWLVEVEARLAAAELRASTLLSEFLALAQQAEAAWVSMDFGFLFDRKRKLFHIGYNVTSDRLDPHYYDLLASEARLASFLSVVLKQAPPTHWHALGRPVTKIRGSVVLLSWGGTMFEYLLPSVFMRSAERTLLSQSEELAVLAQIDYGKRTGTPWGISESGFSELDAQHNYQYHSFGVPALALRRGLEDDMVVAPYACVLALGFQPRKVLDNLLALERLGALGMYGLFEAVDYHPIRGEETLHEPRRAPRQFSVVRSHMAHHQGMVLAALDNALNENVLVARFHANALVKSGELLLNERLPAPAVAETLTRPSHDTVEAPAPAVEHFPVWSPDLNSTSATAALLSNGRLTTSVSDTGAGFTRWKGLAITGGTLDPTCDADGLWIYVRDELSGKVWSATPAPTRRRSPHDHVVFQPHKAEFHHREEGVSLRTEIAVAPLDDVEVRYLTLHNETAELRTLALASYAVPVLETSLGALRHPAFSRMFVECEVLPEHGILARRRKKSPTEASAVVVQHVVWDSPSVTWLGAGLDRAAFIGRRRDARNPLMTLGRGAKAEDGDKSGLEPAMVLALEVRLEPSATVTLAVVTAVAKSRRAALTVARRFGSLHAAGWAIRDAERGNARRLEHAGISAALLLDAMQLVSLLLVPGPHFRAPRETLLASTPGQRQLWGHGISGDDPLLVVRVRDADATSLVTEVLATYRYLRDCRVPVELVFIDAAASGYQADESGGIHRALARADATAWLHQRGGIFVLASDQLAPEVRQRIEASARVYLDDERGALHEQWQRLPITPLPLPLFSGAGARPAEPARALPDPTLIFDNGYGGFTEDGREYAIRLTGTRSTPAPWCNVLTNPEFGCLVSESSLGSTWSGNSGENRLTPWRNDAVSDTPSEALYLRDEETGELWSSTPLPTGLDADTLVRHGAGYTIYERGSHGLAQTLTVFVPPDAPLKVLKLTLHNHLDRPRRLTATYYVEWVLGALREEQQAHVRCEFEATEQCIFANCGWNSDFAEHVAFAAADRTLHGFTCDRSEFLGRSGSMREPEALTRWGLAGATGPGLDPCAALQVHLELAPGQTLDIHFILGEGRDRAQALELVQRFRKPVEVDAAWHALGSYWDAFLCAIQVKTPEPELDVMLNRWLLYQSLSSRFFARSAFYQSSGAYGFRDQLQDVMAFTLVSPSLTRAHILESASHQFEEGDVLHWWHPPAGRGVRTRCSDDLLWLPFVVAHYVAATSDTSILSEQVPFLRAPALEPEEHDRYAEFAQSTENADLFEHCRRALRRGLTEGPRGLPLIGDGDWNDGMNRVGAGGKGESVWLGWFAFATLQAFAQLSERAGHADEGKRLRERMATLKDNIERVAWNGAWYMRAFYDDGSPLGSSRSRSCQIDSIAQSWAVLSGAGNPERVLEALGSAAERLIRTSDRLVLLLDPPFRGARHDPGYIAAYPPGVRENGGQYTHAATWLGWAHASIGDGAGAANVFRLLDPVFRTRNESAVERYRVEPYVLAADVYSTPPYTGRGGWTWYTGAAAWAWRLGVEAILGLYPADRGLRFDPCIPPEWTGFEATLRVAEGGEVHVVVENPDRTGRGIRRLTLDGIELPSPLVHFTAGPGTKYEVRIVLGIAQAQNSRPDDHSGTTRSPGALPGAS
jgi:cyclic beta-1,2-glucan synthetase